MIASPVLPTLADDADRVADRMRLLVLGDRGGGCGALAAEHLASGGKQLRARLAIDAARALGVADAGAVGWGVCCELLHQASLVHDDLEDGDEVRRGVPTTWARHGAAQAINVGDLLIVLSTAAIDTIDADDTVRWRLARCLAGHAARAVRGQSLELSLRASRRTRWEDWEEAANGKTGALFALPVRGAAILAGADPEVAEPFGTIGLLYQLQDDVTDLFGDKGRASGSDVRDGKISALVAQHFELWPDDRTLLPILDRPRDETTDADVDRVRRKMRDEGALDAVLERACDLARAVRAADLPPSLRPLADGLLSRVITPLRRLDPNLPEVP